MIWLGIIWGAVALLFLLAYLSPAEKAESILRRYRQERVKR